MIEEVLAAYWRDYEDHKNDFVPAFLANDILRLWRTFCINYEARTEREPDEKKIKGKIKNYKLKHSRLLTCYSGLLYLLAVFGEKGTVSPSDAMPMIDMSPTERLEWLLGRESISESHCYIQALLSGYDRFLEKTSVSEEELMKIFEDKQRSIEYMKSAYEFGDAMFDAVSSVGQGNRFHRILVV
ncbi:hypothetical protein ASE61_03555 [Bosea sp. Root670]|nr:hypothetical protein ASE61_03555 [Bosea sp. Root670]